MIDLSYLTEEEQEAILAVLKRDAELKKAEEQRVQKLQQIITDRGQLKYLTGEWFYETKQLRHQERIHGSDIILASMKHTYKPMTILELSQIVPERPSFVGSENKEVFVPAVLSGLLQQPLTPPGNSRDQPQSSYEQGTPKPMSPTKPRRNPFNTGPEEPVFTESQSEAPSSQTDDQLETSNDQIQVSPVLSADQEPGKPVQVATPEEDAAPQTTEKQPTTDSTKKPSHPFSPTAKQRLLGFFKRDKTKNTDTQKEEKESKMKKVQSEDVEKAFSQDKTTDATTPETSAQNTSLNEPTEASSSRMEDSDVKPTESLSENSSPNGICTTKISQYEETAETKLESSQITDTICIRVQAEKSQEDVRNPENEGTSEGKHLLDFSKEDGTYRAFPVLIYEDNEDSIICSVPETQISEPKPKLSPVLLPKQQTYNPEDDKPANVGKLKNFWEECSGGRTSAPVSPVHSSKVPSVPSPLKAYGNQKKQDTAEMSPAKIVTVKSVIVNDKGFVGQSVERSPSKIGATNVKEGGNLQERSYSPSKSPSKRSKDDEVRRSPSKTCHPRVLPRESASPEGSRPGSPLKTFPIVIDPEEQKPRMKKSPSPDAKMHLEHSENVPGSPDKTPLVRSIVPQDYRHYLGPHEKAHLPPFQQSDAGDADAHLRPQSPQSQSENKDSRVSCWIEQIKDCSDDTATRAWSLSRASAGSEIFISVSVD